MGLDMYLWKKNYVKNWDFMSPEEKHSIIVKKGDTPVEHIKPERISEITEQVGYWRKANHIHRWFVENVQNGEDDCGEYYISDDSLLELLDICKRIIENKELASELLPTQPGFFFGSTDYDDYYFEDIENTIEIIESLLSDRLENEDGSKYFPGSIYYESSW